MLPNPTNPLLFIITTLLDVVLCLLLLRVILQLVRADFFNPISQLVWRFTQPTIGRMTRFVPRYRRFDVAASLLLLFVAIFYIWIISGFDIAWRAIPLETILYLAVLKIIVMTLNLYTLSLFVLAILSWVGPGVSNPAANVLWSINEPLLRPIRRFLPPVAGLDLSPLVVMLVLQALVHWLQPALGPFG